MIANQNCLGGKLVVSGPAAVKTEVTAGDSGGHFSQTRSAPMLMVDKSANLDLRIASL